MSEYLEAFDPDDPSANNDVVDDNLVGGDNRDDNHHDTAELGVTQITTGGTGQALTTFRVAHQPGDNHRVAATIKPTTQGAPTLDMLNDDNVPPSNTQNPPTQDQVQLFIGTISPLLTVWRRVYVELDSMGPPNATNTQTGVVQAQPTLDPNPANNNATIDIEDLDDDWEQTDQHRVGRIDIAGFGSFTTVNTIKSAFDDQVVIINAPPTIVNANGAEYTLWDDDAGSTPGFVMIGANYPPVTLPVLPDTGFMAEAYAPAYIFPVPDASGFNPQLPTDFVHQMPSDVPTVSATADANKNLTSAPTFWAVHVTSGFQGPALKDFDPVTEAELVFGVTAAADDVPTAGGSVIHLETIRDFRSGDQGAQTELEQFTVVHEVGHQFYLLHPDGAGGFIMTNQDGPTPLSPIREFSPCSLLKMRKQEFPQGLDPKIRCP